MFQKQLAVSITAVTFHLHLRKSEIQIFKIFQFSRTKIPVYEPPYMLRAAECPTYATRVIGGFLLGINL